MSRPPIRTIELSDKRLSLCLCHRNSEHPEGYRIEFLEQKLRDVADMIENESPDVVSDTIWYDNTETLCDALRRWAGNTHD